MDDQQTLLRLGGESISNSKEEVFKTLSNLGENEWLKVLLKSGEVPIYKNIELPGFPPDEVQINFVGSSGKQTLREAFNFYTVLKSYTIRFHPLINDSRILDFGCGWGRIIRFFLKDVFAENLYGIDVDPHIIDICKKTIKYGTYSTVKPHPPTHLSSGSFDLIYAYSVFSHLAEWLHIKWIEEFSRLLKPGGLLIVTTQGRSFIEFCASFRKKLRWYHQLAAHFGLIKLYRINEHPWYKALATLFLDTKEALANYDSGKFLFSATGGGEFRPSSFYGEALIPRQYVEREWTRFLTFKDFIDDRKFLPQALIVMQKPV